LENIKTLPLYVTTGTPFKMRRHERILFTGTLPLSTSSIYLPIQV
jgi:hypothetical protein